MIHTHTHTQKRSKLYRIGCSDTICSRNKRIVLLIFLPPPNCVYNATRHLILFLSSFFSFHSFKIGPFSELFLSTIVPIHVSECSFSFRRRKHLLMLLLPENKSKTSREREKKSPCAVS